MSGGGWSHAERIEREVVDRNRDMLISMWNAVQLDEGQAMLRYHLTLDLVDTLKGLSLNQIKRAGGSTDLLFQLRIDADKLRVLAGPNESALEPQLPPDLQAAVITTPDRPRR